MSEPMRWDVPRPEFIPEQDWQSHDGRIMVVLAAEYEAVVAELRAEPQAYLLGALVREAMR